MKSLMFNFWVILALATRAMSAEIKPLYEQDFGKAELDKVPDDMMVLEGGFAVKEQAGSRFLELPGAPLETFGVLFGPTETNGVAVQARFYGTLKGRRFPTFGVGLNGVGGYRLQASPAKKLLELYKGDEVLSAAPFAWESGTWTALRLQTSQAGSAGLRLEGKAWKQGTPEPKAWTVAHTDKAGAPAGRASLWGSPFAGTPIHFDDLVVSKAASE